jgi:hypothetical protein
MSFPIGFLRSINLPEPAREANAGVWGWMEKKIEARKEVETHDVATDKEETSLLEKDNSNEVLDLAESPEGDYFSVVTKKLLYIWSGGLVPSFSSYAFVFSIEFVLLL